MRCEHCGHEIDSTDLICPSCDKPVAQTGLYGNAPTPQQQKADSQERMLGIVLSIYMVLQFLAGRVIYGPLQQTLRASYWLVVISAVMILPVVAILAYSGWRDMRLYRRGDYHKMLGLAKAAFILAMLLGTVQTAVSVAYAPALFGGGVLEFSDLDKVLLIVGSILTFICMALQLACGILFIMAAVRARRARVSIDAYLLSGILLGTACVIFFVMGLSRPAITDMTLFTIINLTVLPTIQTLLGQGGRIMMGISMAIAPKNMTEQPLMNVNDSTSVSLG